jgi:hypothetical protein
MRHQGIYELRKFRFPISDWQLVEEETSLGTASPLTPPARPKPLRRGEGPALSPLRGEGVAHLPVEGFAAPHCAAEALAVRSVRFRRTTLLQH